MLKNNAFAMVFLLYCDYFSVIIMLLLLCFDVANVVIIYEQKNYFDKIYE